MARHRIRITGIEGKAGLGSGLHGLPPTAENPTGEYPVGFEFDTDADLPVGWKGRAIIVGEQPAEGATFLTGNADDDSEVGKAVRAVIEKAEAEFKRRDEAHAESLKSVTERAEKAEADLQAALDKLAAFDRDGDGKPGGANAGGDPATADEIKSAIALLDGKNIDHWTETGLPRVEAVAEITGKTVTRAAITEAAPDAKRPTE